MPALPLWTATMMSYLIPGLIILIFVCIGYILKFVIDRYVVLWAVRTQTEIDDIVVRAIRTPIILIFTVVGMNIALKFINVPLAIKSYVDMAVFVFVVLAITFVVIRIAMGVMSYYAAKHEGIKTLLPITQKMTQTLILLIALMIIIDHFNISITPMLATLGIAGIALAFALQETLSNFFAGFYIMADRPIRVGDYIKLETGEEGYVETIGWRTTRLRRLRNNIVIVPNSKLANSVVENYYLPEPQLSVYVDVGVSYDSDLEHVEKVTIDVAKAVLKRIKGGVTRFEPFIRYNKFDESSINFTVIMRANELLDRYLLTHEFIKALHKRFAQENIVIPFPQRTLSYLNEQKSNQ